MWLMLAAGSALGGAAAFYLHRLFGALRRDASTFVAVVGWVIAVITAAMMVLFARVYSSMRFDPRASMAGAWGTLAVLLGVLLVVCGVIGLIHRRRFSLSWARAFGVLMAEAGAAVLVALFLNASKVELVRSFNQFYYFLATFDVALLAALLLLEIVVPFPDRPLRRRRADP